MLYSAPYLRSESGKVFQNFYRKGACLVRFREAIIGFIQLITRSKLSSFGALITTVVFPVLAFLVILDIQGYIHNPYFKLFIYMFLGPAMIFGLILVAVGIFFGKQSIFRYEYVKEYFSDPSRFQQARQIILLVVFLTVINVIIITLISYGGYHYTESVSFCGELCHKVMKGEYTAYQNSPHSRVACVECHIGPGASWWVKAKISGLKEVWAYLTNSYPRPIPTPVKALRPARETCEECHRPEFFHGDKLKIKDKFLDDENNTHVRSVMLLKVGTGGFRGMRAQGIHWHVSHDNKIIYRYADEARQQITEVILEKADGSRMIFHSPDFEQSSSPQQEEQEGKEVRHREEGGKHQRIMDCMDCHNRPTHIYLSPEEAIDQLMITGEIPTELPYIKKVALEVITPPYRTTQEAKDAIRTKIRAWYKEHYPNIVEENNPLLEKAIHGVITAYTENVFPEINIQWNTYVNFLSHDGCFRCHNEELETKAGEVISQDCELCHVILAEDEKEPEILKQLQCE